MKRCRKLFGGRGSAQVVALVLLLPLLAALIYGAATYGQMADVQNIVEEAARAGARWLATHPGDVEGARQRAAEVVLGSFTSRQGIEGAAAPQGLIGRLEKRGGRYYVNGQQVRPADEAVRQRLDSLVGKTVVAQGEWAEARVFEAKAATTDPPETRSWPQQGGSGGGTGQPGGVIPVGAPGQKVSANGALRLQVSWHYADVWSGPWSPPGGGKITKIRVRGNSERNYDYGYVYGWNGSSWVLLSMTSSSAYNQEYDHWIDVSGYNVTRIRTRLTTDGSVLYSPTYVDVPEVEVGGSGGLYLSASSHNADLWSAPWSPPNGAKIKKVRFKGNSEANYDYGWVYGWNGSSWTLLARNSGAYDYWIDVSGRNITQLRIRLTTDYSVLWSPTYAAVPEVEVETLYPRLASYQPVAVPLFMEAGKTYVLQVTAKNEGSLAWTPQGRFGLSYHWYDKSSGRVVVWDGARDYVDHSVAPGQSYAFSLPVTAPPQPGTYVLVIDMVQEGVAWFASGGSPTVRADVAVPSGDVLKGLLVFDGEDWWAAGALVRPAGGLDLSRLNGRSAILWGSWTGRTERFFRAASVEEFVPGDWTATETFNPELDVLAEEKGGYAHVAVTYHYPVPLRDLFTLLKLAKEPPSRAIRGEAYFRTGEVQ